VYIGSNTVRPEAVPARFPAPHRMILLQIDRHAGTAVYRQIVEQIRFQVASGVLQAGQELPSTRALAAAQHINPMTVSKAYAELERCKVLVRRPGRPHLVARVAEENEQQNREEQLRQILKPAAQAARQLSMNQAEALHIFARLLDATTPTDPAQQGEGQQETR
jgi:GntR family transcriptional regulator